MYHGGLFFSELDPHIQLNDVEPINEDQYDSGADEVHTINKETQERCSFQTSQASCCDFSHKFDEPSQPKLNQFPVNTKFPSKKTRSFNASRYNRFDWLEYNVDRDAAFCFACKNSGSGSSTDTTFTLTGFRKWTNALDKDKGFMKHQKSEVHKNYYIYE